jgi:aminopeptidase
MIDLDSYANVILDVAVPVVPDDLMLVNAELVHAPLAQALAEAAYIRGARYVDIWYFDPRAKRSRVRHANTATLGEVPAWLDARNDEAAERHGIVVTICGSAAPDLLARVDPSRVGFDRMPSLESRVRLQLANLACWTIVPCATAEWARAVFGEPDAERLWECLRPILRLDQPDPRAAWRSRIDELLGRAAVLNSLELDAVHFSGPGTDLTIGLLPGAHWTAAELESVTGRRFQANLPTEEVFTTPDYRRVNGTVRATRPLALGGTVVRGLELTFHDGVVSEVRAGNGAEAVRANQATDAGAARLGELALVDGSSPVGRSSTTFLETLLDENATCHLAWGAGLPPGVPPTMRGGNAPGVNSSRVHIDFMVGGPEVTVTGLRRHGSPVVLLRNDEWLADPTG